MVYSSLQALLDDHLQELHAAESHLVKAIPQLLEGAASSEFKSFLRIHLEETEKHLERLESILQSRGVSVHGGRCRVVDALIKQGVEISERRGNEVLLDLGLIYVMRHIENYERCAYETARTMADTLGLSDLVAILDTNLKEEEQMERSWTVLSEDMIDTVHAEISVSTEKKVQRPEGGVVTT